MALYLTIVLTASAALYTLAAVVHALYMTRSHFGFLARWSTRAAWLVQSLGLVLLVIYFGRAPFYTLFEFLYFFTWIVVSNYIAVELLRDNQAAGAFVVPVAAVMQVACIGLPKPLETEKFAPGLLSWHIGVSMLGYGFFLASFVCGALYLIQERNLRKKKWGPIYYRLPSLETLDVWGGRFVSVGFTLLTIGVIAGLGFAAVEWAHSWHLDPKVLFTLLVWFIYGAYLLMRKVWGWGGRKAAWWTVIGIAGLLINYFVMNMLSRTHRFGV
ncbi:MAG TPA: cytochrome c biogenesis protein CcsA [Symbiobacteriaceae bacterium]|nr:cytochrome c biogenesis protein CcsA [Symbiobacteriaceae bacterium]